MNILSFAARGVRASRRTIVPLLLLGALTTAAITGSVLAGDFVRESLSVIAKERLGRARYVLDTRSRFISSHLIDSIRLSIPDVDMTACILTSGSASSGDLRVTGIQVVGVDSDFFRLSPGGAGDSAPHPTAAVVNEKLAAALSLEVGSGLLLSVSKTGSMPLDAPLAGADPGAAILSLSVQAVADSGRWGRFGLKSEQRPQATVFVDKDRLARAIGRQGKVNLVLAAAKPETSPQGMSKDMLNDALANVWDIRKAGFSISPRGPYSVLESERVFIERPAAAAIEASGLKAQAVSAYFLDSVSARGGSRRSPFAFAAGIPRELVSGIRTYTLEGRPATDGVSITYWLAQDLGVSVGDSLTLSFRVPVGDRLEQKTAVKRIDEVLNDPISAQARALMPSFPGMTTAQSCTDWDAGIPLDMSSVRRQDEDYWDTYRGTPKVYLSTEEGARLWSNAYGDRTAYFFPGEDPDELAETLSTKLVPSVLGISFTDAADYGLSAQAGPLDFGTLFLGLSLFLVAASLLLTAMTFSLHVAQKERETGVLMSLGFLRITIVSLRLIEALMLAAASAVFGCILGVGYSLLIAAALNGAWSPAIAGGGIAVIILPRSLALSAAAGAAATLLSMGAAAFRKLSLSPASLLRGAPARVRASRVSAAFVRIYGRRPAWIPPAAAAGLPAITAGVFAVFPGLAGSRAMGFFISGAAALAALLVGESVLLGALSRRPRTDNTLLLAVRNAAFRRRRTLAASAVIACGLFVVASVGANPWLVRPETGGKRSGAGGFAYFVQTSRPFKPEDIRFRMDSADGMVSGKFRDGDDASCLNLIKSATPPILGIPPSALEGRFSFTTLKKGETGDPWRLLDAKPSGSDAYAFADSLSLEWNLGLAVGDTISVMDEFGRPFRLEIAGALSPSVFQGWLVISEDAFRDRFPSVSGKTVALIEAGSGTADSAELVPAFRSFGAEIQSSGERLESFARVQYAYLSIFLFLGAAGLLFGMAGFAAMTVKSVREDAGSRALLRALGFLRIRLILLSVCEQSVALIPGLAAGAAASLIALLPMAGSGGFPASTLLILTAGAAALGLSWSAAAAIPVPEPERRVLLDIA